MYLPVNDGIDLLIEAIKNAPDIKPIKKKVLDYTPAYSDSTTTPFSTSFTTEDSSDDESQSDSDKTSSDDVNQARARLEETEDTIRNKFEENKELAEIIIDDDKDPEDKYQFDRRVGMEKTDDITETALYNRAEDNLVVESENALESTTVPTLELSDKSDRDEAQENIHIDPKPFVVEDNNVEKTGLENKIKNKKVEEFIADMDEESIVPDPNRKTASEWPPTDIADVTTRAKKRTKMRRVNLEFRENESIDKKTKLEWIEENFGREKEKEFIEIEENKGTELSTMSSNTKAPPTKKANKVDVSALTKEDNDETDKKKKKAKFNTEDIMLKKQMDLLNSLDYGTERSELDEPDSKDSNVEDKYSSDPYPTYFV